VSLWLRGGVSLLALWLAFRGSALAEISATLRDAPLVSLLAAFLLYILSQVTSALRWRWIARGAGFPVTAPAATRYYFVGMYFGAFGPGLIGGDLVRAAYLARGGAFLPALSTVVMDRYVGFVWLTTFASTALLLSGSFSIPPRLCWLAHSLTVVALASWWLVPRIGEAGGLLAYADRWPAVQALISSTERRSKIPLIATSILIHALQAGAAVALLRGLVPSIPWSYAMVFHPFVAMLSSLPISLAGLGVRESSFVYFLAVLERVPVVEANAFAAAWLAMLVLAALSGAVAFLVGGERLPRSELESLQAGASQLPPSS
jgi:uncharacterized membrane protein YbhN (UPF0104 family)